MKPVFAFIVITLLASPAASQGFAVVELFTSEGCSSCPPADKLLAELAHKPGVYALEFHVDYWNSLGWRDPYSATAYSNRQRDYGDDIYTPQMVVNGTNVFVGSNRQRAEQAIGQELLARERIPLTVRLEGDHLAYRVPNAPGGFRICVAVVDPHKTTKVIRGENAGSTLEHARVVRGFVSAPLAKEGSVGLPAAVREGSVVAFVQDPNSHAIFGATEVR